MGWSSRPTGLTVYSPGRAHRGYTLFAPNGGDEAYLIDMEGLIVHRWHSDRGIDHGNLLPNGNLLVRNRRSRDGGDFPGASAPQTPAPGSDGIQELSWDGEVIWEYRDPSLRRCARLANGNTLVLKWEEIPEELSRQVKGGFASPGNPKGMMGDLVVEITSDASVVYEWRSAEHLSVEEDIICPLEARLQWSGANDLTALDDGNFLISFRLLSSVAMVDRSSGSFIWKWGSGQISHQHHPTLLDNGHVLLLDNGCHKPSLSYSRVIEVDTSTNEIAWEYHGEPLVSFFTHFTGGAERLPGENTLISEGATGRVFEVTLAGETVWEYVNPFFSQVERGFANGLFRAHRYGPDFPALAGRDLDPARYSSLNHVYGGSTPGTIVAPETRRRRD